MPRDQYKKKTHDGGKRMPIDGAYLVVKIVSMLQDMQTKEL
jgi:hypothetical protein